MYLLERTQIVAQPRSEVFAFFADAANLERLTPPFLAFHILTPSPIEMKAGALIDYRIRLSGIPLRWRTRIEELVPDTRFVDVQLKGPYARWHHTHTFRDVPGGTEVGDRVEYALPLGPLGTIAHAVMVRRQLRAIFDYRAEVMRTLFGAPTRSQPVPSSVSAGRPVR